jgi:hypothetical protein
MASAALSGRKFADRMVLVDYVRLLSIDMIADKYELIFFLFLFFPIFMWIYIFTFTVWRVEVFYQSVGIEEFRMWEVIVIMFALLACLIARLLSDSTLNYLLIVYFLNYMHYIPLKAFIIYYFQTYIFTFYYDL